MGKLKYFSILLHSENNVYYPGNMVQGKCLLELRNELKVRTIKIAMKGLVRVYWTEARTSIHNLALYTEHINSEMEYFFEKKILFDNDDNSVNEGLGKGRHEFEFSFQLPVSGLSTSFEGKYGNIRYWIVAEIEKPWSFSYRTKKAFTLISPIDINSNKFHIPLERSVERSLGCLFCIPDHISLYARTDRTGESIAINAKFSNHTRRIIIPRATLHQMQLFQAEGKSRTRNSKLTTVTGVAISAHKTVTWHGQLLHIPPVPPSIPNCRLIRIEYKVRISLKIPYLGCCKCFVDIPIVIGTVPLHQTNYPIESIISRNNLVNTHHSVEMRDVLNNEQQSIERIHSSVTPPPSYVECIHGSVDIEDEDEEIIGNTRFTPRYTYVNRRDISLPPAYSEMDPFARQQ